MGGLEVMMKSKWGEIANSKRCCCCCGNGSGSCESGSEVNKEG